MRSEPGDSERGPAVRAEDLDRRAREGLRAAYLEARQADARDDVRFHAEETTTGLASRNPEGGFHTAYDREGVDVEHEGTGRTLSMRTRRLGCSGTMSDTTPGLPTRGDDARRVEWSHAGPVVAREWYLNGPLGLEQGYTVDSARCGDEPLVFEVELDGLAASERNGRVVLADESGREIFTYGELFAKDATGALLDSRLALVDRHVRIEVDARAARFPVVVDPLVATAETELHPDSSGDGETNDAFGTSVAYDGTWAAVGAPGHLAGYGAVYVFERTAASTWVRRQEIPNPDAANNTGTGGFGTSVALLGNRLGVGNPETDIGAGGDGYGSVYVYERPDGSTPFTMKSALARGGGGTQSTGERFGTSVALAPDGVRGDIFVAGAPGEGGDKGAVYHYRRALAASGTWSLQERITKATPTVGDEFGASVAVNDKRLLVGAPGAANGGRVYRFDGSAVNASFTSSAETAVAGSDTTGADRFGAAIDLDGSDFIVGAPNRTVGTNTQQGQAYFFSIAAATNNISQQGNPIVLSGGAAGDHFGSAVAVSTTVGSLVAIGAPDWGGGGTTQRGGVFGFVKVVNTWNLISSDLNPPPVAGQRVGASLANSGASMLVGVPAAAYQGRPNVGKVLAYQGTNPDGTIDPGRSDAQDSFGRSIAASGDLVVIGAPYDDSAGVGDGGAAYVFLRNAAMGTWSLEQKIVPPSGMGSLWFGYAVAIDGDRLAVGAPNYNGAFTSQGVAFVYSRVVATGGGATWNLEQTINDPAPGSAFTFGSAVGLSGAHLVVTAPGADAPGPIESAGKVVFFERTGAGANPWTQATGGGFTSTPTANDGTGFCAAIQGNWAFVGSPTGDQPAGGIDAGFVSVYRWNGSQWASIASVAASPYAAQERFGQSIAIDSTTVVVGIPGRSTGQGAIAIYSEVTGNWMLRTTLVSGVNGERFGSGVALQGKTLVVGAAGANASNGKAYVYVGQDATWPLQTSLAPASFTGQSYAGFGSMLALSNRVAVVAAPNWSDTHQPAAGRAFPFAFAGYPGDACSAANQCVTGLYCTAGNCCDQVSCGNFRCGAASCLTQCTMDSECITTAYCSGTSCQARKADGQTCAAGRECLSGNCNGSGVCGPAITPDAGTDGGTGADGGTGDGGGSGGDGSMNGLRSEPSTGLCSASPAGGGSSPSSLLVLAVAAIVLASRRRGRALSSVIGLVLVTSLALAPSNVRAQTTDQEAVARAQFQLGQAYLNDGRFHEAGQAFEAAYAASNRPQLLYNAYVAYRDAQELENAASALRRFIAADPNADTPMMRGRLEALERQIASERAARDAAAAGATTTAATTAATTTTTTATTTTATTPTETAATTSPETTAEPSSEASESHGSNGRRIAAYSLIGGGAALAVVGFSVSAARLGAEQDRLNGHCGSSAGLPAGQCYDDAVVSDVESKTTMLRAVGWSSLAVGVGAAAAGVVLLVTGHSSDEPPRVTPTAGCVRDGCMLGARGRF